MGGGGGGGEGVVAWCAASRTRVPVARARRDQEDYEVVRKIGRGKYSEVRACVGVCACVRVAKGHEGCTRVALHP
jgi:hypothetical protein